MQKEELLHLHMLMVQIKKYYENVSGASISSEEYDSLDVSPLHIHKNKNLHRVALMTLGNEIVSKMKAETPNQSSSTIAQEKRTELPLEHS